MNTLEILGVMFLISMAVGTVVWILYFFFQTGLDIQILEEKVGNHSKELYALQDKFDRLVQHISKKSKTK